MESSSIGPSRPPAVPDVNLYCSQCQAQIGIFRNEWIRLTSSYARSKTRGKHFGTEIGQKTQIVPPGPLQRSAEGCEMVEVLCCKCSNVVGQYCKSAPDPSQMALVDQYFYKLSRTFLKNNQTKIREQPAFVYSPDLQEPFPALRSGIEQRNSMTPMARWSNTPLREASSTPSVQTATRSVLRNESFLTAPRRDPLIALGDRTDGYGVQVSDTEKMTQELAAQNSMLREHSSRLSHQTVQYSDHEGRLRDHHMRIEDQENCVRAQATRILEQDDLIQSQNRKIEQQDIQLKFVTHQLTNFQKTLDDLQTTIKAIRSDRTVQRVAATGQASFVDNFELMIRVMRDAQSIAQEIQSLRAQNQDLQSRLARAHSAVDTTAADDIDYENSADHSAHSSQILGKRKRNLPAGRTASSRSGDSPLTRDKRSVRFEDQHTEQPAAEAQHSQPAVTFHVQHKTTAGGLGLGYASTTTAAPIQAVLVDARSPTSVHHNPRSQSDLFINEKQTHVDFTSTEGAVVDQDMEESVDELSMDHLHHERNMSQKTSSSTLSNPQAPLLQAEPQVPSGGNGVVQANSEYEVAEALVASDDDYQPQQNEHDSPDEDEQLRQGTFGEDTKVFDDNIDFSSDDEYVEPSASRSKSRGTTHRRVTDLWSSRDARSMAPEPGKRRRSMPASTGPKLVTLDRVRLATPQMFSEAISKGDQPKLTKPPRINTRQENLHNELRMLGLEEWITKDKKCKEYRDIVAEARAQHREANKARFMREKGISYGSSSKSVLNPLQNTRTISGSPVDAVPGSENPLSDKSGAPEDTASGGIPEELRVTRARARQSSDSLHVGLGESEYQHEDEAGLEPVPDPEPEPVADSAASVKQPGKKGRPAGKGAHRRRSGRQSSVSNAASDHPQAEEESAQPELATGSVEMRSQRVHGASATRRFDLAAGGQVDLDGKAQNGLDNVMADGMVEDLLAQFTSDSQLPNVSSSFARRRLVGARASSSQMSTEDMVAERDRMATEAMERDD